MKPENIGAIIPLNANLAKAAEEVRALGMNTCQLNCWNTDDYTDAKIQEVKKTLNDFNIVSLWAGWPGPVSWDFWEAPLIDGFVPPEYRVIRIEAMKKAADFAGALKIPDIVTHAGFIPENPADSEYIKIIAALREAALYCKKKGIVFNFETGQETPVTLMRCIANIGTDNLGVNLDPANLILYGKGNPVDSVEMFGKYIRSLHIKDGNYPTDPMKLGEEQIVGEGMVDFEKLLSKLKKIGFDGSLIIEREISGPQQQKDIIKARDLIKEILGRL